MKGKSELKCCLPCTLIALLAAVFIAAFSASAMAGTCEDGITRCGADGIVQRCAKVSAYTSSETHWEQTSERCSNAGDGSRSSQAGACADGITQCGANGYIERCAKVNAYSGNETHWVETSTHCP